MALGLLLPSRLISTTRLGHQGRRGLQVMQAALHSPSCNGAINSKRLGSITGSPRVSQHLTTGIAAVKLTNVRKAHGRADRNSIITSSLMQGSPSGKPAGFKYTAEAWYFFSHISAVFLLPYIPLLYSQVGMEAQQIGLMCAVRTWFAAAAIALGPLLADQWGCHRELMTLSYGLGVVLRTSLWFWAGLTVAAGQTDAMVSVAIITLVAEIVGAPAGVLGDAAVVASTKTDGEFGQKRVWASLAWGAFSPLSGYVLGAYGLQGIFYGFAAFSLPAVVAAYSLSHNAPGSCPIPGSTVPAVKAAPEDDTRDQAKRRGDSALATSSGDEVVMWTSINSERAPYGMEAGHPRHLASEPITEASAAAGTAPPSSDSASSSLRDLLSNPRVWIFLWQCVTLGFGVGIIGTYCFIYMRELGAPATVLGLILTFNCLAEAPVFFFQGALLNRISPQALLHVALGALVLRMGLYTLLPQFHNPWFVLPVELLHGITFAAAWGACNVYSKRLSTPNTLATMQGLMNCAFMGVGAGAGGLLGGQLIQRLGMDHLWASAAGIVAVGWGLAAGAEVLVNVLPARPSSRIRDARVKSQLVAQVARLDSSLSSTSSLSSLDLGEPLLEKGPRDLPRRD